MTWVEAFKRQVAITENITVGEEFLGCTGGKNPLELKKKIRTRK
jgi:hypothetical protein